MPIPPAEFCARATPTDAVSTMPMLTTIPTIFQFMKASAKAEANAVVFMDASLCLASSVGRLNTLDWGCPCIGRRLVSAVGGSMQMLCQSELVRGQAA